MATTRHTRWFVPVVAATVCLAAGAVAAVGGPASYTPDPDRPAAERLGAERLTHVFGRVDHIVLLGDSQYADIRDRTPLPPHHLNDIAIDVERSIRVLPAFQGVQVENRAIPGLALWARPPRFGEVNLADIVDLLLAGWAPAERPQVAMLGFSAVDINTFYDEPIDELAGTLVAQMQSVVARLDEHGIQVVVLPIVPVNDAMYSGLWGLVADQAGDPSLRRPAGLDARVRHVNAAAITAGLPVLFDPGAMFDDDGDGHNENAFYAGAVPNFPDDGIHLSQAGRRHWATRIAGELVALQR